MQQEFNEQLISFMPKMRVWALALTRNRAAADDLRQDPPPGGASRGSGAVPPCGR